MMRAKKIIVFLLLFSSLGCGSSWVRINDLDRNFSIDKADCFVFAKTLIAERGDYVVKTSIYAYSDNFGNRFGNARTNKKISKKAYEAYYLQCMNEHGWVPMSFSDEKLSPTTEEITRNSYVLMDMDIKNGADLLRKIRGGLYLQRSNVLSDDIKIRLLGKKLNDTIEFEKVVPTAATATQIQLNKLNVSIKINGIYKRAKKNDDKPI